MFESLKADNCVSQRFNAVLATASLSIAISYAAEVSDGIVIGNILGEEALSAIALIAPVLSVVRFINCIFALGSVTLVVAAAVKGNEKEADNVFSQAVILEIVSGILTTLILFLWRGAITGAAGATGAVLSNYLDYYTAMMFLPTVQGIHVLLYCCVIDEGGGRLCYVTALVESIGNIALSIALGLSLGIFGVGLATVLCTLVGDIILLTFFIRGKSSRRFHFYLNVKTISHVLKHSLYDSSSYFYLFLLESLINIYLVKRFTDYSLIIFAVILKVIEMVLTGFEGIADTSRSMVSLYYSEKNQPGTKRLMRTAGKASMLLGGVMTLLLLILGGVVPKIFGVENENVAKDCALAVRVVALSATTIGLFQVLAQFYLYIGREMRSFVINALPFLLMIPMAIFGGEIFGIHGVWIGMAIAPMVMLVIYRLLIYLRYKKDRDLLLLDPKNDAGKFIYDVQGTKDEVMRAVYKAEEDLETFGVDKALRTKIELMMEESGMMIVNRNTSDDFLIEFSVIIQNDEKATLVVRDGGVPQDSSNDDALMPASLEEYASLRLIASQQSRFYGKIGSLNRQVFSFLSKSGESVII